MATTEVVSGGARGVFAGIVIAGWLTWPLLARTVLTGDP